MLLSLHDHADVGNLLTFGSPSAKDAKWVITILRKADFAKFQQLLESVNVDEITQLKNFHFTQEVIDAVKVLDDYQRRNNVLFGNALTSKQVDINTAPVVAPINYFTGDNNDIIATHGAQLKLYNAFLNEEELVALVGIVEGEIPKPFFFRLANIGCDQVKDCRIDTLTISTAMNNLFDIDFFNTFEKKNLEMVNPFYNDHFKAVDLLSYIPELTDIVFCPEPAINALTMTAISSLFMSTLGNIRKNSLHPLEHAFIMPADASLRLADAVRKIADLSEVAEFKIADYKALFIAMGDCIMSTIPYYRGVVAGAMADHFQGLLVPKLTRMHDKLLLCDPATANRLVDDMIVAHTTLTHPERQGELTALV